MSLNLVWIDRMFEPLMPLFWAGRQKELEAARRALEAADCARLAHVGHTLRGTAGCYGFARMAEIGDLLEHAAMLGNLEACAGLVTEYGHLVATTQIKLI